MEDHESIRDSRQAERNSEGHRCEAGMLHVGIPVSTGHQLGDEEDGGRTEDRHQMGLYKATGGH